MKPSDAGLHPGWLLALRQSRSVLLLLAALLASGSLPAGAQEIPPLVVGDSLLEVRLRSGESYVGRIDAISGDTVTMSTVDGTRIQFDRSQVTRVQGARGQVRGETFWREDPNDTRLFFSPTARTLRAGDGYVGVYELFVPFVVVGVSDRLLLAGGSPFYLALAGGVMPPLYFGPKLQLLESGSVSAAVGGLAVLVPDDADEEHLGVVYGVGTWGTRDHALSAGAGWGYVGGDLSSQPVVMVGGETRVGRSVKLLSENLFVPGEDGVVISGGLRLFGERLSADAGLATMVGDGDMIWLPVVNVVYNFGPQR